VSLLGACGPGDQDEPQSTPNKTTSAISITAGEVPFVTLRNRIDTGLPKVSFGDERGALQAGHCGMSRKQLPTIRSITEKVPFYIPDEFVTLDAVRERPIEDFWRDMRETSKGRRPVLYVHGYYINFKRACKRALLFQDSLDLAGQFLLFSWPSDGAILNYTHDESDLYWSVAHLKETIVDMTRRFGAGNFDIVAHSLGARGAFLALALLAQGERSSEAPVNQVVLLAPDIDVDIFGQYLPEIRTLARHMTLYVSNNDHPLALSEQVHGRSRVGQAGSHLSGLTGVEIIDISDVDVRYPSGHVYHLYNNIAVDDLYELLKEGKSASQRSNLKQTDENYWHLQQK
jgi:esterase/lipase superfamily enzyme